jgi:hypothetical protein
MHRKARMLGQPLLHGGVLMGGIVAGDQVQRLSLGCFTVDLFKELQPFGMSVAVLALTDDLAIMVVERSKQRGRAIALIVMCQRAPSSAADQAACGRAPAPDSSRRSTAPAHAQGATCTPPRCLQASPRTSNRARP